ncbi:MAG: hypothetical protein ACYDAO_04760 [Thermoplasmataceae archaeon]
MIKERVIQILSNLLILSPAIFTFYYVEQNIFSYVIISLYALIFAIPIMKNTIPKYGYLVYPLAVIISFTYIFLSLLHLLTTKNYLILQYFNFPFRNSTYLEQFIFTFFTALPFIFIVEALFSKKLQRILSYLVISMADLLDMVVAIQINSLLGGNIINSFTYANALFGLNLYTLFFFGYEFVSIFFHVSTSFNNNLDITFIISIFGVISYFFFVSEGRNRVRMDGIALGFLYGGIATVILSYAIGFVSGSFEELMVISVSILITLIWLRRSSKQKYYTIGDIEVDGSKESGSK